MYSHYSGSRQLKQDFVEIIYPECHTNNWFPIRSITIYAYLSQRWLKTTGVKSLCGIQTNVNNTMSGISSTNKSINSLWLPQNAALLRNEMRKSFCQSFILNLCSPAHLKVLSAINPGSWILARGHRLFVWYRSIHPGWKPCCVYIASVMRDDSDLCGTVHVQRAGTERTGKSGRGWPKDLIL